MLLGNGWGLKHAGDSTNIIVSLIKFTAFVGLNCNNVAPCFTKLKSCKTSNGCLDMLIFTTLLISTTTTRKFSMIFNFLIFFNTFFSHPHWPNRLIKGEKHNLNLQGIPKTKCATSTPYSCRKLKMFSVIKYWSSYIQQKSADNNWKEIIKKIINISVYSHWQCGLAHCLPSPPREYPHIC